MKRQASKIEQQRAFGGVIDALEAVGAEYAVWGGMAAVAHGETRFTQDMDILIRLDGITGQRLVKVLLEDGYHVDPVAVTNAISGGFFNAIHLETNLKIDFFVPRGDALLREALNHPVRLRFDEIRQAAYVSVEVAVISKLRAYANSGSNRHLDDVASMIRVRGAELDRARIETEAVQLGVFGEWRALWENNSEGG